MLPAIKVNWRFNRIAFTPTVPAILLTFAIQQSFVAVAVAVAAVPPAHELALPQIVRIVESVHFGERRIGDQTLSQYVESLPVSERFKKPAGVFVTLSEHGKTRACWGSVFPDQPTIIDATISATMGALTREYRFRPVQADEWKHLKAQVTVIRHVEPIDGIGSQNPWRYGLMVRSGGRGAVLLPGEASDAYYQLVQCKLKAGIRPDEPCQLYRLRCEIYE